MSSLSLGALLQLNCSYWGRYKLFPVKHQRDNLFLWFWYWISWKPCLFKTLSTTVNIENSITHTPLTIRTRTSLTLTVKKYGWTQTYLLHLPEAFLALGLFIAFIFTSAKPSIINYNKQKVMTDVSKLKQDTIMNPAVTICVNMVTWN